MKVKNVFTTILVAMAIHTTVIARQKFNVQNGMKTEFYNDLETDIEQAQARDTIYLPAGACNAENDIVIDKKLALIGVGGDINGLQATFPTEINRQITFTGEANGSLLTGCKIIPNIYIGDASAMQDIRLIRNYITIPSSASIIYIYIYAGSSNIFIRENHMNNVRIYSNPLATTNSPYQCFITNNLFSSYSTSIIGIANIKNSYIINNVFTASLRFNDQNHYSASMINHCIIQNNYFYTMGVMGTDNIYDNNAFIGDVTFPNANTGTDNLVNQAMNDTFENYASGNYHIKETSPCKNAGTDGTDIGIYGGALPYKEGSLPFNPNIRPISIST